MFDRFWLWLALTVLAAYSIGPAPEGPPDRPPAAIRLR